MCDKRPLIVTGPGGDFRRAWPGDGDAVGELSATDLGGETVAQLRGLAARVEMVRAQTAALVGLVDQTADELHRAAVRLAGVANQVRRKGDM